MMRSIHLLPFALLLTFSSVAQVESSQSELEALKKEVKFLRYTELAQSMSQRSLLTPGYHAELKGLIAAQAYNFWQENSGEIYISHLNIYSALHDANKYLGQQRSSVEFYNQIKAHSDIVVDIKFGADPNVFYSAGSDGKIFEWNLNSLNQPPKILFNGKVIFRSIDVSFDGKWILAVTKENGVYLINTENRKDIDLEIQDARVYQDPESVQQAIFLPNELKFVSITKSGDVKVKGYQTDSLKGKTNYAVRALAVDPKNKELFAGTEVGVVQIWNKIYENSLLEIPERFAINTLALSPNNKILAIGREKGDAVLWDLENKDVYRIISGHQSAITDMDFNHDGTLLVTSSRDGTARVWDVFKSKKLPLVLSDHNDWVMSASFNKTGTRVLTGSKDRFIRIWPTDPAELKDRICQHITRNLNQEEWDEYVGAQINFEETCPIQN